MSKIIVLGGVGFIGSNLALEAIKRGHEVVAFDNLSRKGVENNLKMLEKQKGFTFIWGDVRKRGDFEKLPKADAMINLAANPSVVKSIEFPAYDFETNCMGTVNSLDYARHKGLKYIYASTNKCYSDITNEIPVIANEKRYKWQLTPTESHIKCGIDTVDGIPESINENFPLSGFGKYGHSLYGIGKLAGELYCQEYHVQFKVPMVIFRMSCIFGLWQCGVLEQGWVDFFLRQIMTGGDITLFGTGKQIRDVLDGRDTARAYLDALENIDKVNGEIFTLGGGKDNTYSLLETIEIIEKLTGKKAKVGYGEKRPSDQDVYCSSISKIRSLLGWQPEIGLEKSLKDMINEY